MPSPDLNRRVEALERRSRILGVTLTLACAALVVSAAAPREGEVVRARAVQLVDGEGRVRAELAMDADGSAGLFVRDEQARVRASITHDAAQSALYLWDEDGTIRLGAAQFAHGGGGYALHGPQSKGGAVLYLKERGSLTFYDRDGNVVEQLPD